MRVKVIKCLNDNSYVLISSCWWLWCLHPQTTKDVHFMGETGKMREEGRRLRPQGQTVASFHQVHITLETLTSRRTCLFSQTLIYLDEASSIKTASERNILAPDPANQCHYHYTLSETRRGSSAVSRGGQTALGKWGQAQVQGQGSKVKLPGKWAQLCRDVRVYGLDVRSVWTGDQSRPLPLCLYWWVAVSLWSCGQTQGSAKLLEKWETPFGLK